MAAVPVGFAQALTNTTMEMPSFAALFVTKASDAQVSSTWPCISLVWQLPKPGMFRTARERVCLWLFPTWAETATKETWAAVSISPLAETWATGLAIDSAVDPSSGLVIDSAEVCHSAKRRSPTPATAVNLKEKWHGVLGTNPLGDHRNPRLSRD